MCGIMVLDLKIKNKKGDVGYGKENNKNNGFK
jgi:hypothetical protein